MKMVESIVQFTERLLRKETRSFRMKPLKEVSSGIRFLHVF